MLLNNIVRFQTPTQPSQPMNKVTTFLLFVAHIILQCPELQIHLMRRNKTYLLVVGLNDDLLLLQSKFNNFEISKNIAFSKVVEILVCFLYFIKVSMMF